jgi:hypothetical protein
MPPTDSHTLLSDDRQQVTGPSLALQQIGGQFTRDKSMVKEVCETVDQQVLTLTGNDNEPFPSLTEEELHILQAERSTTSYATN